MKFYIQCLASGNKMLHLVNIRFKSVACLYQCLYNSSHSYKLNFTYMFSTTDARTIFSSPVEMQRNTIQYSWVISHCKSAPRCKSILLNRVFIKQSFKKSFKKTDQKWMNKFSHSRIHQYPLQSTLCVVARDPKPRCQGLQKAPPLDMFPPRHQLKLRSEKSSSGFLSSCNARKLDVKGNSSYVPWPS